MEGLDLQQILVTGTTTLITLVTALFTFLKYASQQDSKREKQLLEYFEKKNGHLERISNRFADAMDKNTEILGTLKEEIRVLVEK